MVSKKKKVFTGFESDFLAEIGNSTVFSAQKQVVSKKKKKKRSSTILRLIFRPKSDIQTFEGGCFSMGGLFSIFHKKSASKPPNRCDFAYFTCQWGISSPPPPPLATLLVAKMVESYLRDPPNKDILAALSVCKNLKNLFIKLNTPLPSSAAVERLFSLGKDILRPKRASLSDEHFEMMVFLKGNLNK